ncbi:hypothetical protein ON010_g7226 [Phytophthora cinnamomi]|nr:hypothetical protein ON010_g7226 [Phytophthora cinnamomi]
MRDGIIRKWMEQPVLAGFVQYMCAQWLFGRYSAWQIYSTPSGFASTNNPVETFNVVLKRDSALRRRLRMGALLQGLSNCCEDKSSSDRPFRFDVVPSPTLTRRVSEMMRENLLETWNDAVVGIEGAGQVRVVSTLAKRFLVAPNNRSEEDIAVTAQMGANYARMEVEGQPWGDGRWM